MLSCLVASVDNIIRHTSIIMSPFCVLITGLGWRLLVDSLGNISDCETVSKESLRAVEKKALGVFFVFLYNSYSVCY